MVTSFSAANSFATNATFAPLVLLANSLANSVIPKTSAPALSQNTHTRSYSFARNSSKSSHNHSLFLTRFLDASNANCKSSLFLNANLFESPLNELPPTTFCTACAAPASNKFPANAISIADFNESSELSTSSLND